METELVCSVCRERHGADRVLSFDGIGVNSCGVYRTRLATLHPESRHLGRLISAAPEMLKALIAAEERLATLADAEEATRADLRVWQQVRAAIAKAQGQ